MEDKILDLSDNLLFIFDKYNIPEYQIKNQWAVGNLTWFIDKTLTYDRIIIQNIPNDIKTYLI